MAGDCAAIGKLPRGRIVGFALLDRHRATRPEPAPACGNAEFRSDNSEAIYETALRGRGIGLVASHLCYHSIENGNLVHLLPEWTSVPEAGVYVAYSSSSKHLAPKVRVFSDFLVQKLKNVPW